MTTSETEMESDHLLSEVAGVARAEHDEILRASIADPVAHELAPDELRRLTSAALELLRAGAPVRDGAQAPLRNAPETALCSSRRLSTSLRSRVPLAAACASAMALAVVMSWRASESQVTMVNSQTAPEPKANAAPRGAHVEMDTRGLFRAAEPPSLEMRAPPRAPLVDPVATSSKAEGLKMKAPKPLASVDPSGAAAMASDASRAPGIERGRPAVDDAVPAAPREETRKSFFSSSKAKAGLAQNAPDRARASDFESQVLAARRDIRSASAKAYFDEADAIDARADVEKRGGLTEMHPKLKRLREQSAELRAKARRILEGGPDDDSADTPRKSGARRP